MRFTKAQTAYALLIVCASARLLLQMAAMPPYAGLDEVYHVARLAFVRAEHRNPTTIEPSIPPYLMRSIANGRNAGVLAGWPAGVPRLRSFDTAMPAMGEAGEQWPMVVSRQPIVIDRPLTTADLKPYIVKNYEAQQTSPYYSLVAPLVPARNALFELRVWRAMSLLFALITVLATAEIGRRWFGPIGILGGALLVSLPTWETLVMRAGNDAFACMLAAIAVLISVSAPKRLIGIAAEAIVWGLALNAKMYTWPLLIILPLLWRRQRASKSRVIAVAIVAAIAVLLTFAELSARTQNPLGVVAFDRPGGVVYVAKVNIGEIVRVTIASFAWTSGQHNDALRPIAIALYLVPIFAVAILAVRRRDAAGPAAVTPAFLALGAFALAQTYNVVACVLANRGGNPIPIGGKEGWYWYVLAPVIIPALLVPAVKRWRAAAWWIVIWDVIITEVALFHDFAGTTSPAHGSMLFRWGPLHAPFTAHLDGIGVGPLAAWTTAIRIVHLATFFGLESFLQHMRLNDRNTDTSGAG
ncbi:MAG: hypothetical protein QOI58_734 [Thermoanaerobaculia bacterium]|jgi:hypothetical protein|nr:hypothetical protein [Thermoanaerobaculia bacterium]